METAGTISVQGSLSQIEPMSSLKQIVLTRFPLTQVMGYKTTPEEQVPQLKLQ